MVTNTSTPVAKSPSSEGQTEDIPVVISGTNNQILPGTEPEVLISSLNPADPPCPIGVSKSPDPNASTEIPKDSNNPLPKPIDSVGPVGIGCPFLHGSAGSVVSSPHGPIGSTDPPTPQGSTGPDSVFNSTVTKICIACNTPFIISKTESHKKYCGRSKCYEAQFMRTCEKCGTEFTIKKGEEYKKLCLPCYKNRDILSKDCVTCGEEFKIKPGENWKRECLECYMSSKPEKYRVTDKISVKSISWLNYIMDQEKIFIHHNENGGELEIWYKDGEKNKLIFADGYHKESQTVYEFYGDFWHGNPKIYPPIDRNEKLGKTFGELYSDTLKREEIIKNKGYKLITIWESEWDNIVPK